MMRPKIWIVAVIGFLIFGGCFCLRLWRPARQVELHTEHLLRAAGKRDWKNFDDFLDASYTDRWGHDKVSAIEDTRTALQQFFGLRITAESPLTEVDQVRGILTARLKVEGTGTAVAHEIKRQINELRAPFTFEWRQKSWKPWDWQLVRADNPELNWDRNFAL